MHSKQKVTAFSSSSSSSQFLLNLSSDKPIPAWYAWAAVGKEWKKLFPRGGTKEVEKKWAYAVQRTRRGQGSNPGPSNRCVLGKGHKQYATVVIFNE